MNEVEVRQNGKAGHFTIHFSPRLVVFAVVFALGLATFNWWQVSESRPQLLNLERKVAKIEGVLDRVFPVASRSAERSLAPREANGTGD